MMMIRIILFLLTFTFVQAQEVKKPWRVNKKLQWSDFKGKLDASHPFSATTATGLSYKFSAEVLGSKVKVNYVINSFFIPLESWVKKDSNWDKKLLAHEQLHFDITELYARKFRKKMNEFTFSKNLEKEIEAIYKPIAKERVAQQKLYDEETNHSKNRFMQKQWEVSVARALLKYKEFASK